MSTAEVHTELSELDRVELWRAEALEKVGYDTVSAIELAGRHDVDLHLAIDLIERGCSPETALRILL